MSLGSSKLNPYAAAYVPLAKRVEDVSKLAPVHSESSKAFAGSSSHNTMELYPEEGHGFYGSSSQEDGQAGSHADDGQLEMDLAYLQTLFPAISEQSLIDVYFVNECDLDAAFDMLTQLEHSDSVPPQNLPDCLDIGDVSEPQILPDFANLNLKLKEVVDVSSSASAKSPAHAQPQS